MVLSRWEHGLWAITYLCGLYLQVMEAFTRFCESSPGRHLTLIWIDFFFFKLSFSTVWIHTGGFVGETELWCKDGYNPFPGCLLTNFLCLLQWKGVFKGLTKRKAVFSGSFSTHKGENGRLQRGGVEEVKLHQQNETGRMRQHMG